MRLRHIEVFNAIMLTGSVSAAARLINVTQPAVSRVLQHAEIQLGFALFQRVKGRLEPTEEAQTLYPYIERLFAQLDEVQRLAASLRADAGRHKGLHVLTVLALSHEVLPRALRLFRPDAKRAMLAMPPLLRTYLLMGGWVSDHAVVDRDLNTLHVFTGLEIRAIPPARARLLRLAAG